MDRDDSYGEIAKRKVMAPLDGGYYQDERIVSVKPVTVRTCGLDTTMYIIITSSKGADLNGRILLSFDESGDMSVGGIFFVKEAGKKKLQSVYLDSDMRGGHAMRALAEAAKAYGIKSAVGPFSSAGLKTIKRYGFKVVR